MGGDMKQKTGDNCTNIQVSGNMVSGITYEDAKQIALDVFKANFIDLSKRAKDLAIQRAEEITNEFVKSFFEKIPQLSFKLEEPGVQDSIFTIQKEYAKNGDKEFGEQALELLIERIKTEEKGWDQIALDEALRILPKLTHEHIQTLSLILSVGFLNPSSNVVNLKSFNTYIENEVMQFYCPEIYTAPYSLYSHLQSIGCCSVIPDMKNILPFVDVLKYHFSGLFCKGFTTEEFKKEVDENMSLYFPTIITNCLRDSSRLQFNAMTTSVLEERIKMFNLCPKKEQIIDLWKRSMMSDEEIRGIMAKEYKDGEKFIEDWNIVRKMMLTPVGFAIAITNYNKQTDRDILLQLHNI